MATVWKESYTPETANKTAAIFKVLRNSKFPIKKQNPFMFCNIIQNDVMLKEPLGVGDFRLIMKDESMSQ